MTGPERLNKAVPPRPEWLAGEPDVVAILDAFLEKLDKTPIEQRTLAPALRLNKTLAPTLYRHDEASDTTWELLKELDGIVFDIRHDKKRQPFDPQYAGARLRLLPAGEVIARAWLDRPRKTRYQDEWTRAVENKASFFYGRAEILTNNPIRLSDKTASEIVDAFASLSAVGEGNFTLRQLSARAFWGHSKVLDGREELIAALFPSLAIAPRPVLTHVRLPAEPNDILFIENLDTYLQTVNSHPGAIRKFVLVYTGGFKGGAERIRQPGGASLHYHFSGDASPSWIEKFENWWFSNRSWNSDLWFWGDLDFSGMAILKVLRQRFGNVRAWPKGYAPLVSVIREGGGHTPDIADKIDQIDPGNTGCNYADRELLPLIRSTGRFADQELAVI